MVITFELVPKSYVLLVSALEERIVSLAIFLSLIAKGDCSFLLLKSWTGVMGVAAASAEFACVPKSGVLKVVVLKIRGVILKTGALRLVLCGEA